MRLVAIVFSLTWENVCGAQLKPVLGGLFYLPSVLSRIFLREPRCVNFFAAALESPLIVYGIAAASLFLGVGFAPRGMRLLAIILSSGLGTHTPLGHQVSVTRGGLQRFLIAWNPLI
jgi:hypothetical protein